MKTKLSLLLLLIIKWIKKLYNKKWTVKEIYTNKSWIIEPELKTVYIAKYWRKRRYTKAPAYILIALLLLSCSSTQKNKSKSVEESKTESLVEVKDKTETTTNTESNTVTIDTTNTDETVIEPIDNSKEFVINGKTYKNARIKTKKVKSGISVVNNKKVAKNEQKDVKTTVEAKVENRKVAIAKHKESDPTKQIIAVGVLIVGAIVFLAWWFLGIGKRRNKSDEAIK